MFGNYGITCISACGQVADELVKELSESERRSNDVRLKTEVCMSGGWVGGVLMD